MFTVPNLFGAWHRKKAKTGVENIGVICFESHNRCITDLMISSTPFFKRKQREWGRQIAQLQNLKRIQTQTSHKVSKMDLTTANEPLNPMAPSIRNLKSRGLKTSGSAVSDFSPFCRLYIYSQMNSLFLNFIWTPVKHYLLLIKSPQLVLVLASTPW